MVRRSKDIEPGDLGCINLGGLNKEKLEKARRKKHQKAVDVMENPRRGKGPEFLILDGHHTAYVAQETREKVTVRVWGSDDRPRNPLIRLNLTRAGRLHQTAAIVGRGTIADLEKGK